MHNTTLYEKQNPGCFHQWSQTIEARDCVPLSSLFESTLRLQEACKNIRIPDIYTIWRWRIIFISSAVDIFLFKENLSYAGSKLHTNTHLKLCFEHMFIIPCVFVRKLCLYKRYYSTKRLTLQFRGVYMFCFWEKMHLVELQVQYSIC